jgi:hypothetical protein
MHRHTTSTAGRWIAGLALFAFTSAINAQTDTTTAAVAPETTLKLRPTFGVGAGMFSFFGDVGSDHKGYNPLVTRIGYELRATAPINEWLSAGLYALHGRLGVNERSLTRNLNFESRITVGGFQFRYNFHHLLNAQRRVEPFISLGFESVEFLTKTDLYDRQGRMYNYWSDGSIRDIAENAPNAADAVIIQRDYTYESDVRELDRDGFGKYLERTWAIPIGLGARMDFGGGFDLRVGTTIHYTMTDLIDGVSDQSIENRKGDSRNDRFIYSSVSIGYAVPLQRKPKQPKLTPLKSEELDLIVLNEDEDADGVKDVRDWCPHTPTGAKVDLKGCPTDGDMDLVADHQDDELNTDPGAAVDMRGVSMTDEDFLKRRMEFIDSGNVAMNYSRMESFGPMPPRPQSKRVYVVKVGSQVEGISEELIQQILSIPDVRTIERNDTTYYVVGNYEKMPEALRRELELRGGGIQGMVMAEEGGKLIDVSKETVLERARLSGELDHKEESGRTTIRVQLGAFRQRVPGTLFRDMDDVVTLKGEDGITRYFSGSFTDINLAAQHKVQMLLKGFEGAFLVAFKDGKRISLKEAGAVTTGPEDLSKIPPSTIKKELLVYRVQVATFAGNVPIDAMADILELGEVRPVPGAGSVRYFHGSFGTREDAEKAMEKIRAKGFKDAFVVGDVQGHIISADDADHLLGR